jgi:hypothetical protein
MGLPSSSVCCCGEPARRWHGTAAAVHGLLGTSNLVFWPLFGFAGMLAVGYVTTVFHGVFAMLQLAAALGAQPQSTKPA